MLFVEVSSILFKYGRGVLKNRASEDARHVIPFNKYIVMKQ